jgi:hypothetical protein
VEGCDIEYAQKLWKMEGWATRTSPLMALCKLGFVMNQLAKNFETGYTMH